MKRFVFFFAAALTCGASAVTEADVTERAAADVCHASDSAGLTWDGVDEDGVQRTIALRDYFESAKKDESHLLVVRVQGGAWCGTCRWSRAHTGELFALPHGDRVRVLDLVVGDRENARATARDAVAWRGSVAGGDHRIAVAADPSFAFRALVPTAGTVLPLVVLVDTRSMNVLSASANPDPSELAREVDAAFASMDERPLSPQANEPLVDGFFHRNEWEMIRDTALPKEDAPQNSRQVAFGKALFFDRGISPAGVSCASCHDPTLGFGDSRARAHGAGEGDRKTPRIALAAHSPRQFWDGRASSLEEQVKGPIENASEMASTPAFVARHVASALPSLYREAFPSRAIDERDPDFVSRTYDDVTKAIAAYERTLRVEPNALDAYIAGDRGALTALEKQGLAMFAREGCMQCHWGPRLTDDAFHVTRTPTGRIDGAADVGREQIAVGAFKTPSLRGVAHATSFAHGGVFRSIDEVVGSYGSGGLDARDARAVGERELWIPRFGETTRWSIDAFVSKLE